MIGCNRPVEDVSGGRLRRGVGVAAEDIPDQDIDNALILFLPNDDCLADQGSEPGSEWRGPEQVIVAGTNETLKESFESAS
ncbi:hypothetical protein CCUS01_02002 [Colletotrichum cuscutae]|uniref:Uncharacterized protein n=1 Tax=Colletotrichum cuscutae TaxID=1209917 RepID=A0AAI9UBI8_9PEZI|nr:hypothetical protein CCUS01_02002 [Colletotrichum cuscutae]